MESPKRVAIVRVSAMGDIIHTLASVQFIKEHLPETKLVWFVDEVFAEILRFNYDIDEVVTLPLKSLKKEPKIKSLKSIYKKIKSSGEFDLVIDAQGLIKSALVARVAGKNVVGLDKNSARERLASLLYRKKFAVDCKDVAPVRFATLISKALGFEIGEDLLQKKRAFLFWDSQRDYSNIESYFHTTKRNIVAVVGASNPSKIYPKESWIGLISQLRMYNILLIAGSKEERKFAREIEQNSIATLLPRMDLNELKYAVALSDLLIGNDTGPSHIAWGLNRPSILLFGSTPTTMMMQTPQNIAISTKPEFRACRFDKDDRSIAEIEPQTIVKRVLELLGDE